MSVCDIYAFPAQNWTTQVDILSKTNILDVFFVIVLVCPIRHTCLVYTQPLFLFSAPRFRGHTLTKWLLTKRYC